MDVPGYDIFGSNPSLALTLAMVAPLAIEGGALVTEMIKHRKEIPSNINKFFKKFSSNPIGEETKGEAKSRQVKNLTKLGLSVLLVSAVAATSFNVAPPLLAVAGVVATVALIIKTLRNPAWVKEKCQGLVSWLKTAYVPQKGETRLDYVRRLTRNILITSIASSLLVGGALALHYLAIGSLFMTTSSGWVYLNPSFMSQITAPGLIYFMHIAVGLIGIDKAIDSFKNKEYLSGLFNLSMGLLACIAPFGFAAEDQLRWHHLSYGLALAILTSLRALQCFGSIMAVDGALYFINSDREYDFSNIFVDNLLPMIGVYAIATGIQLLTSALFLKKKKKATITTDGDQNAQTPKHALPPPPKKNR